MSFDASKAPRQSGAREGKQAGAARDIEDLGARLNGGQFQQAVPGGCSGLQQILEAASRGRAGRFGGVTDRQQRDRA